MPARHLPARASQWQAGRLRLQERRADRPVVPSAKFPVETAASGPLLPSFWHSLADVVENTPWIIFRGYTGGAGVRC